MDDHEKNVSCSQLSNISADEFGVSWGEERPSSRPVNEKPGKLKCIKHYSSFYLEGIKYGQNDTVYLNSGHELPHIARIVSLYENVKTTEKHMHVRWFCRPCELPEGLPDVGYSENCNEVFMMWGKGAKNDNNPACTLRHCTVLCTAEEEWNKKSSSIEVAAADHIFYRAFDSEKFLSLDVIVKQCGEHHVTGIGRQVPVATETNGDRRRRPLESDKNSVGRVKYLDRQPVPLAMRATSDLPPRNLDWKQSKGSAELGFRSPKHDEHRFEKTAASPTSPRRALQDDGEPKEARSARLKVGEEGMSSQAANPSSKKTRVKPDKNEGTFESSKKPRVERADASERSKEGLAENELHSPEVRPKLSRERSTLDPQSTSRSDALDNERPGKKLKSFSRHSTSEVNERSRLNPDRDTQTSKFKMSKLSSPHIHPVELISKVPGFKENGPTSMKLAERNPTANNARWEHSHGSEVHKSPADRKHDSRGLCPPVDDRRFAKVNVKNVSNLNFVQIQASARTQSMEVEKQDVRPLISKVIDRRSPIVREESPSASGVEQSRGERNKSTKEENHDDIIGPSSSHAVHPKHSVPGIQCTNGGEHGTEDLSGLHQNSANMKHTDSERHIKGGRGKAPREDGLAKTSTKGRLLNECKGNVEVVESYVKPSGTCESLSSGQRAGPTKRQTTPVPEGLKVSKVRHVAKGMSTVSSNRLADETTDPRSPPRGFVDIVSKSPTIEQRMLQPALHDSTNAPSDGDRAEIFEPKEKIFNFPWQASLRIALEHGKALFLENLDPLFSSFEIEALLQELLQVSCDVRMLPPKDFACFTSGQALVLFRSQKAAVEALRKFTENWVIWSKDERPVLASTAEAETSRSSCFHGFFDAGRFGPLHVSSSKAKAWLSVLAKTVMMESESFLSQTTYKILYQNNRVSEQDSGDGITERAFFQSFSPPRNASGTSHCSQPNTVEYDMGIQWRLLQDRHTQAWMVAAQEHKVALDQMNKHRDQRK